MEQNDQEDVDVSGLIGISSIGTSASSAAVPAKKGKDKSMEVDEDERVHEFVRGSPERAVSGDDVEEEGSERSEEGKRLYPLLKDGDAEFRLAPLVGSGSGSSGSASGIRHGDGHSPRSYASISAAVLVSAWRWEKAFGNLWCFFIVRLKFVS